MLCQECNQRIANYKYRCDVNGKVMSMNLCSECLSKLSPKFDKNGWPDLLGDGDFGPAFNKNPVLQVFRQTDGSCNKCGMRYTAFINSGNFGCSNCYSAFNTQLQNEIMPRLQRGRRYVGRQYGKPSEALQTIIHQLPDDRQENGSSETKSTTNSELFKNSTQDLMINSVMPNLTAIGAEQDKATMGVEALQEEYNLDKLEQQLAQAVAAEKYLEAAKLRDQIIKLKSRIKEQVDTDVKPQTETDATVSKVGSSNVDASNLDTLEVDPRSATDTESAASDPQAITNGTDSAIAKKPTTATEAETEGEEKI